MAAQAVGLRRIGEGYQPGWTGSAAIGLDADLWANAPGVVNVPANQPCTPGNQCASLSAWASVNPAARIVGLSTGISSGWDGKFAGAVDNISFTVGGTTKTYDFEVAAVPEPGTWALMILGFGGVGAMVRRRRVVAA